MYIRGTTSHYDLLRQIPSLNLWTIPINLLPFGDTKLHKETLKDFKGRFNPSLTYKGQIESEVWFEKTRMDILQETSGECSKIY